MKRALVLALALAALAMLVPDSREKIVQLVPTLSKSAERQSAQSALEEIAVAIQGSAAESGSYPGAGPLTGWLTARRRSADDPWGSAYYFELWADSFVVGSAGPDARVGTTDDLRVVQARRVTEPGVLILDHAPSPPPSSAKRTAVSKALEAKGNR